MIIPLYYFGHLVGGIDDTERCAWIEEHCPSVTFMGPFGDGRSEYAFLESDVDQAVYLLRWEK